MATSSQVLQGLPQPQKFTTPEVTPFQGTLHPWTKETGCKDPATSAQEEQCSCAVLAQSSPLGSPELRRARITLSLLPLHNLVSLPFPSRMLIPNKLLALQTPSQHLLLENPSCPTAPPQAMPHLHLIGNLVVLNFAHP